MKTLQTLRLFHQPCVIMFALVLSACQTLDSKNNWPSDVPDRRIFVTAYQNQIGEVVDDGDIALEKHLVWVKRFYQGSIIYPIGWNRMTEMVLDSLDESHNFPDAEQRIAALGKRICIEWAQDNRIAKIRSSNIAVWGAALRKSVNNNQQKAFIELVEKDVEALIAGELDSKQINQDRYYPEEDIDDF